MFAFLPAVPVLLPCLSCPSPVSSRFASFPASYSRHSRRAQLVWTCTASPTTSSTQQVQNGSPAIRLMACDLDGTLLNSKVSVSSRNISTIKRLIAETSVLFVPATGKSRAGAVKAMAELGKHLQGVYPRGIPGVFLQGLIVFGLDGKVILENKCDDELARNVVKVAKELGVSLLAYSRDCVVCEKRDKFLDLIPTYHEPQAEEVGDWEVVIGKRSLNKFIFMAEPERIDEIRPYVAERVGDTGHLTQAQGNMLEVLPPNSSKGNGVREFLKSVAVAPENVLAIGDAENDLELLEMVGCSCAVANALPSVRAVAMYTDLKSNNDDGVAEAIERFILVGADVVV